MRELTIRAEKAEDAEDASSSAAADFEPAFSLCWKCAS
jgi:hypothetical protein